MRGRARGREQQRGRSTRSTPSLPRQWFSLRFAPAQLRPAPRSGFSSGTSSCTSSRAPRSPREINEPGTYWQAFPGLVRVNARPNKIDVSAAR